MEDDVDDVSVSLLSSSFVSSASASFVFSSVDSRVAVELFLAESGSASPVPESFVPVPEAVPGALVPLPGEDPFAEPVVDPGDLLAPPGEPPEDRAGADVAGWGARVDGRVVDPPDPDVPPVLLDPDPPVLLALGLGFGDGVGLGDGLGFGVAGTL